MKGKDLLKAMSLADEEYVRQADPTAVRGRKKSHRAWAAIAACLCCAILAGSAVLFVPFNSKPTDVSKYAGSEYYPIINQLNLLSYVSFEKPEYKNNFEKLKGELPGVFGFVDKEYVSDEAVKEPGGILGGMETGFDFDGLPQESLGADGTYQEITDNQVQGVTEADRIKRSDRYIYYLDGETLRVYSIEGKSSKEVGSYNIAQKSKNSIEPESWELYLSRDCRTVTVMMTIKEKGHRCVSLITLDVSDPTKIKESGSFSITGDYISSRLSDGKILLATEFVFDLSSVDFDKPETYLPMVNDGNGLAPIASDKIVVPSEVDSPRYTIITLLDATTLELKSAMAHLSYTDDIYVTAEHLYLARVFADKPDKNKESRTMTEITCMDHTGDRLKKLGSVTVKGYIKDQWSMDELNGILRVVTTTNTLSEYHLTSDYRPVSGDALLSAAGRSNASLYCIDTKTWKTVASVEDFAPDYEEVQSVRFDGDIAYVCTSIEMSDPVFFFDLSDLNNITCKDTGTIDGYSSSLVNFGNGYLLGIGRDDWDSLKVEVYEETDTGVRSVDAYKKDRTGYSTKYKSYLIDREKQLVGMGITESREYDGESIDGIPENEYLLLHFDGYKINEIVLCALKGEPEVKRGVVVDGYLYMLGENDFKVEEVSS